MGKRPRFFPHIQSSSQRQPKKTKVFVCLLPQNGKSVMIVRQPGLDFFGTYKAMKIKVTKFPYELKPLFKTNSPETRHDQTMRKPPVTSWLPSTSWPASWCKPVNLHPQWVETSRDISPGCKLSGHKTRWKEPLVYWFSSLWQTTQKTEIKENDSFWDSNHQLAKPNSQGSPSKELIPINSFLLPIWIWKRTRGNFYLSLLT